MLDLRKKHFTVRRLELLVEMVFPDHLCKLWEQHIQSVFDAGKSSQVKFAVEMVPGKMHFDLVFNPEFSPDGNVNSVIGISRDISERKRAEVLKEAALEALQQKNDELERFQPAIPNSKLTLLQKGYCTAERTENAKISFA